MAVSSETARNWLHRPIEETDPQAAIVLGNLSIPARAYMESNGTHIEEIKGLFYITLPMGCDVSLDRDMGNGRYTVWHVTFDGSGGETATKPGAMQVYIESELVAFESRAYVLPIPLIEEDDA